MSEENGALVKTPKQLIIVCVLALAIPVAIALLGAQLLSGSKHIDRSEPKKQVEQRIKPVGELMKFDGTPPPAPAAASVVAVVAKAKSGEEVYNGACVACHGVGIAGAPKTGDKALWSPRVAQGVSVLYEHAIKGYKGMPAKGGQAGLSDDEVKAGVDYQIAKLK